MNCNDMWNHFDNTFNSVLNSHAPTRYLTRSELKRYKKPWLTPAILKSIKCKQKLFRKVINKPSAT